MKVLFGPIGTGLEKAIPQLRERHTDIEFAHCPNREDVAEAIADVDIYVGHLNADIFNAAKNLKWIQSPSSGVNMYVQIPGLVASDVLLTSAAGTHGPGLAESTLGMIFAFTRGIRTSIFRQQEHVWAQRELRPQLSELTGTTMGIIGFGAFGRHLAERAQVFGVNIFAVDLYPANKPDYVNKLLNMEHLDDLLRESDYVVIALPITPETDNLIDADKIALMKPTAMIVAMSRGGIVDQDAVAQALQEKRLGAAALEVTRPEPLPADSYLWDVENLLITAHIAGGTQHEGQYVLDIFTENLERFLAGNFPLRNQVNKEEGF
ncbi:MAG: D-2-hydroxyacid dehydrogenase [Chloroflexota bacterium]